MDEREKTKLLKDMDDEVGKFHPFLLTLFQKMQCYDDVIYNHGREENGADIILVKKDDVTQTHKAIYCIVKTGVINKNFDKSGISDQINQCISVERTLPNGVHIKRPSEIWVITNQRLSSDAKELLPTKAYPISPIECKQIIDLVDRHYQSFWSLVDPHIDRYITDIRSFITSAKQSSRIGDFSNPIEINLKYIEVSGTYDKSDKQVNFLNVCSSGSVIVLEGGAGFGKSTTLHNLVLAVTTIEGIKEYGLLPVYVEYSKVKKLDFDLEMMLETVNAETLEKAKASGIQVLYVVDAVDESYVAEDEQKLVEMLNEVDRMEDRKIVIASRPMPGLDSICARIHHLKRVEIAPIETRQIIELIKGTIKGKALGKIAEDLSESDIFKQLPRCPIAAILLSQILNTKNTDLPASLPELYSKYTEMVLGRWDIDKGILADKEYQAADIIVQDIAMYMFENSLPAMAYDEAFGFFERYIGDRNIGIDPIGLYDKVLSRSNILVCDTGSTRTLFKHRTFLEFFAAKQHYRKIDGPNTILNKMLDPTYKDVAYFYCGINPDQGDLFEKHLDIHSNCTQSQRIGKLIAVPGMTLAAYHTNYNVVKKVLYDSILSSSKLFIGIISGEDMAGLEGVPTINILYLFTRIVKGEYGYQYFKGAMPEIAQMILDSEEPEEVRYYATYFASVAMDAIGIDRPYDQMIESIRNKRGISPVPLQLGVFYENQKKKDPAPSLNRYMRWMKKRVGPKADVEMKRALHEIHRIPLSETNRVKRRKVSDS